MPLLSALLLAATQAGESHPVPKFHSTALDRTDPLVQVGTSRRGITARGRNWKAEFDADGAAFAPFLGSAAPRNFHVRFAVEHLARGGVSARLQSPRLSSEGERVLIERGPVRSEYVAAEGGLEQLFVFDEALAGTGDLTLDLGIETELSAEAVGRGFSFRGAYGGVDYGASFAIDAAGRRLDLEPHLQGMRIRFTIPAQFLADAEWSVAIDPWIRSTLIDTPGVRQDEVDVAFDPVTSRFRVVFEEQFSTTDFDIRSIELTASGDPVPGSSRYLDASFANCRRPRIASCPSQRAYLGVYELRSNSSDDARIEARSVDADTGHMGGPFIVDSYSGVPQRHADVCGDANSTNAHFTVVWEREVSPGDTSVHARVVDASNQFPSSEVVIANPLFGSANQPAISSSIPPGATDSIVVWRGQGTLPSASIRGRTLSRDGLLAGTPFTASSGFVNSYIAHAEPRVSSLTVGPSGMFNPGHAVVAWEDRTGPNLDVSCAPVIYTPGVAAFTGPPQNLSAMEHRKPDWHQSEPDVAAFDGAFVVTYAEQRNFTTTMNARASTINMTPGGLGLRESRALLHSGGLVNGDAWAPKACTGWESGGATLYETMIVSNNGMTRPDDGTPVASLYRVPRERTPAVQFDGCVGTNHSMSYRSELLAEGSNDLTTAKTLHAHALPFDVFGFFVASNDVTSGVMPVGSSGNLCLGGAIGRYSNAVLDSGPNGEFSFTLQPSQIARPSGPVAAQSGETWYFQAWHRDTLNGTPTSNFTNAVGVTFE